MCLVLAAVGVLRDAPLVLLANRDEAYDRPSEPPRPRPAGNGPDVVCGLDLRGGGTWLGRNAAGVVAALTNRPGPQDPARPSRGSVPLAALASRSALDGAQRAAAHAAVLATNPFSMLVADRDGAWCVVQDTAGGAPRTVRLADGLHTLTNTHDLDRLAPAVVLAVAGATPASLGAQTRIDDAVALFERVAPSHAALDGTRMAPCVHAPEKARGTVSSAIVVLGRDAADDRFLHAAGPPCTAPFALVSA